MIVTMVVVAVVAMMIMRQKTMEEAGIATLACASLLSIRVMRSCDSIVA
jgi:hypothetical protein